MGTWNLMLVCTCLFCLWCHEVQFGAVQWPTLLSGVNPDAVARSPGAGHCAGRWELWVRQGTQASPLPGVWSQRIAVYQR